MYHPKTVFIGIVNYSRLSDDVLYQMRLDFEKIVPKGIEFILKDSEEMDQMMPELRNFFVIIKPEFEDSSFFPVIKKQNNVYSKPPKKLGFSNKYSHVKFRSGYGYRSV